MGFGSGYGSGRGRGYGRGRGAGKGYTCIKFLFFAFNVIFWLLGCAILGIGIWLQVSKGSYVTLSTSFNFFSVTFLLICVGTLILLIGFFGCCGSLMENRCLLFVYFILVALTFILEIVAAVLIFVYRWEINNYLAKDLKQGLVANYKNSNKGEDGLKEGWAYVQSNFNCCGVYNYTDWFDVFPGEHRVPRECCVDNSTCHTTNKTEDWFQQGCSDAIQKELSSNLHLVGIVTILIIVLEVLGLVASMSLICLKREKYYNE